MASFPHFTTQLVIGLQQVQPILAGELSEWKAKVGLLTSQSSSGPYWVTSMKFSHVHGGFNIAKKSYLKGRPFCLSTIYIEYGFNWYILPMLL
jgi:hypothetical protein